MQARKARRETKSRIAFSTPRFPKCLPLFGYAYSFAVKPIPGRVAVIRWVVDANHPACAFDPAGAGARLLDFCFFAPASARHALARTVQTVFGGIALVRRIIHAGHTPGAFNYARPAAGQFLFIHMTGFRIRFMVFMHPILCLNISSQTYRQAQSQRKQCGESGSHAKNRRSFHVNSP